MQCVCEHVCVGEETGLLLSSLVQRHAQHEEHFDAVNVSTAVNTLTRLASRQHLRLAQSPGLEVRERGLDCVIFFSFFFVLLFACQNAFRSLRFHFRFFFSSNAAVAEGFCSASKSGIASRRIMSPRVVSSSAA